MLKIAYIILAHKYPEQLARLIHQLNTKDVSFFIHIDNFVKQNPKFINRFNYTLMADELFYQILVLNSPFKDKIINDHLRYLDWENINSIHPRILETKDFEKIRESEKLFARKFDLTIDQVILDMIDEMVKLDV
ncbi:MULTISPECIES: hypothetical protein [unclassified Nostoc]|uniref:hypothetical protein n=1 Tax=unclassified Nostoc TaxID=2593658 RepID=UPI001E0C19E1|nr:hypothetical protein [Nostoc sp. JL23]MBN3879805.1 hypothetical protein [Nostoc sp. JL23]